MKKTKTIGLLIFYNDADKVERSVNQLLKICDSIFLIHDGPADEQTKKNVLKTGFLLNEWPRRFCKEAHLVHFFHLIYKDNLNKQPIKDYGWVLHLDADEFLSDAAVNEINSAKSKENDYICARALHQSDSGQKLCYSANSNRIIKPILINIEKPQHIVGLPHKGIVFTEFRWHMLKSEFLHLAPHISKGLFGQILKEWRFANNDSILRTQDVCILNGQDILLVPPCDKLIPFKDRLLNRYPLIFGFPASIFSVFLSIRSCLEARNFNTLLYEFKLLVARSIYYLRLAALIYIKRQRL
jgi:hypothetical protein